MTLDSGESYDLALFGTQDGSLAFRIAQAEQEHYFLLQQQGIDLYQIKKADLTQALTLKKEYEDFFTKANEALASIQKSLGKL